jgi:hypothetical protein
MNILNYLDNEIEKFRQTNNDYPKLILMSKETKDKLIAEIKKDKEPKENGSWQSLPDNYKGISIKIKQGIFIEIK